MSSLQVNCLLGRVHITCFSWITEENYPSYQQILLNPYPAGPVYIHVCFLGWAYLRTPPETIRSSSRLSNRRVYFITNLPLSVFKANQ